MPFNAGGSTTRTTKTSGGTTWASDAAASNPINAAEFDTEAADTYAMLALCITKDGNQTVTSDIPMNSHKFTGLSAPVSSTDSATKGYVDGKVATYKVKASNTDRSNTNSVAADPDLQLSISTTGTYQVDVLVNMGALAASNGLRFRINYTGTFTSASSYWGASGSFAGGITSYAANTIGSQISSSATFATDMLHIKSVIVVTGAGTVSFDWAQFSSGAAATRIGAGSYLAVTQIA